MLNFGNIDNWENPTAASNTYEKELTRVLNQLTPEKTKLILKKEKRPWYNDEVANMKRVLRRSKKIGVRNGTMISWKAYQQVRRSCQIKLLKRRSKQ